MALGSYLANKNIKNSSVAKHSIRLDGNTNHLKVQNMSIIMMVAGPMTMSTNKKILFKSLNSDKSKNHSDRVMIQSISEVMMIVGISFMKYLITSIQTLAGLPVTKSSLTLTMIKVTQPVQRTSNFKTDTTR